MGYSGNSDIGLFPSSLADKSSQVAAISGLGAECITFVARLAVGNFFLDFGGNVALCLDIIELVLHEANLPFFRNLVITY